MPNLNIFNREISVKTDDVDDNTCRVQVVIPGVKKPSWFSLKKTTEVDAKFCEQSLRLLVEIPSKSQAKSGAASSGPKRTEKILYEVRRLPDRIIPDQCTFKIRENQIELTLKKETPRSWVPELSSSGLETVDEAY